MDAFSLTLQKLFLLTDNFKDLFGPNWSLKEEVKHHLHVCCQGLYCRRSSVRSAGFRAKQHPILNNVFFNDLLDNLWYPTTVNSRKMFKVGWQERNIFHTPKELLPQARGRELLMYASDLLLVTDPELRAICHEFAADNAAFLAEVARAWPALVNADMFSGPLGNRCL